MFAKTQDTITSTEQNDTAQQKQFFKADECSGQVQRFVLILAFLIIFIVSSLAIIIYLLVTSTLKPPSVLALTSKSYLLGS